MTEAMGESGRMPSWSLTEASLQLELVAARTRVMLPFRYDDPMEKAVERCLDLSPSRERGDGEVRPSTPSANTRDGVGESPEPKRRRVWQEKSRRDDTLRELDLPLRQMYAPPPATNAPEAANVGADDSSAQNDVTVAWLELKKEAHNAILGNLHLVFDGATRRWYAGPHSAGAPWAVPVAVRCCELFLYPSGLGYLVVELDWCRPAHRRKGDDGRPLRAASTVGELLAILQRTRGSWLHRDVDSRKDKKRSVRGPWVLDPAKLREEAGGLDSGATDEGTQGRAPKAPFKTRSSDRDRATKPRVVDYLPTPINASVIHQVSHGVALQELLVWLVGKALKLPKEDPPAYRYVAHHTAVVLGKPPSDEGQAHAVLFHLQRAVHAEYVPPPPGATPWAPLRARGNRWLAVGQEGTASLTWPDGKTLSYFDREQWPGRFHSVYFVLALHARMERTMLSKTLTRIAGFGSVLGARLRDGKEVDAVLREELDELIRDITVHSAGLVSEDAGGVTDYAWFYRALRDALGVPSVLAELRREAEGLDTLVRQVQARQEERFRRVVEHVGLFGLVVGLIGTFGSVTFTGTLGHQIVQFLEAAAWPISLAALTLLCAVSWRYLTRRVGEQKDRERTRSLSGQRRRTP